MASIAGIILCGGASRRMGRPKYSLAIDGQTLLARTVRVLQEVVHPVIVVAAQEQEIGEGATGKGQEGEESGGAGEERDAALLAETIEIVRDRRPHEGPLAGMVRGFESLPGEIEAAFVAAVDLPLLKADFVRGVVGSLGEAEVAVPQIGGVLQPLAAVYRVSLLDRARRLAGRGLGPRRLVEASQSVRLTEDILETFDPGLASLTTFSTPEEWERLQGMIGRASGVRE